MAKYTGYVETSRDFEYDGKTYKKGQGYSRTDTGAISQYEPGGRPEIPRDPNAPEGDFVKTPQGKYVTDFSKPKVRGDYGSVYESSSGSTSGQARSFSPGIPQVERVKRADDLLKENYNLTQDGIQSEFLQKQRIINELPKDSSEFAFLSARNQMEQTQKFAKADTDYQQIMQKFEDLNNDKTIDSQQTQMAQMTLLDKTYKLDTTASDLEKAIVTPEEKIGETIKDSSSLMTIYNKLSDEDKDSPMGREIKSKLDQNQTEVMKTRIQITARAETEKILEIGRSLGMSDEEIAERVNAGQLIGKQPKQDYGNYVDDDRLKPWDELPKEQQDKILKRQKLEEQGRQRGGMGDYQFGGPFGGLGGGAKLRTVGAFVGPEYAEESHEDFIKKLRTEPGFLAQYSNIRKDNVLPKDWDEATKAERTLAYKNYRKTIPSGGRIQNDEYFRKMVEKNPSRLAEFLRKKK